MEGFVGRNCLNRGKKLLFKKKKIKALRTIWQIFNESKIILKLKNNTN